MCAPPASKPIHSVNHKATSKTEQVTSHPPKEGQVDGHFGYPLPELLVVSANAGCPRLPLLLLLMSGHVFRQNRQLQMAGTPLASALRWGALDADRRSCCTTGPNAFMHCVQPPVVATFRSTSQETTFFSTVDIYGTTHCSVPACACLEVPRVEVGIGSAVHAVHAVHAGTEIPCVFR